MGIGLKFYFYCTLLFEELINLISIRLYFVFDELMNLISIWLYYVFDELKRKNCILYMYLMNLWENNCILYLMSLWGKKYWEKNNSMKYIGKNRLKYPNQTEPNR